MKRFLNTLLGLVMAIGLWSSCAFAQEVFPATVRVTVQPEADLYVNHKKISYGATFQLELPPGEPALLEVAKSGYVKQYRVIKPEAGERRLETFALKQNPIPVLFRCSQEAMVLCDGQELGHTPLSYFFTEAKVHRIIFRAPGFDDRAVRLNLENGTPQVVNAELIADAACLVVKSTPDGAQVFINGVPRGVTPCELPRLRQGSHMVEVRKERHHAYQQMVELRAGETYEVAPVLRVLSAGLSVTSNQVGATVYINGTRYGVTPLTMTNAVSGAYAVRVEKEGFKPLVRTVTLTAGETLETKFDLEVQSGVIKVKTQPGSVRVVIDDRRTVELHPSKEKTHLSDEESIELPVGEHTLRFKADGYTEEVRNIRVKQSGNEPIRVSLKFAPNFEIRTETAVHRGVFIRENQDGSIVLELRPGMFRTFSKREILGKTFWSEKQ